MTVDSLTSGDAARADDIVRFFERVLPRQGFFVTATSRENVAGMPHELHRDFHDAADGVACCAGDCHMYFAPASFNVDGRSGDNAQTVRSFWVDLDCGPIKPYPDQAAAVGALATFRRATGLWKPLIVNSGHGIHAYWSLDADIAAAEWRRLATSLKRAAADLGLHADPSRTSDVASLMRVPGSDNVKGGGRLPVSVLHWGEVGTCAQLEGALAAYAAPQLMPSLTIEVRPAYFDTVPMESLFSLSATDLSRLESALMDIPPANLRDRDMWRKAALLPLTAEAVMYPESDAALRELFHKASGQPGAWEGSKGHEGGYSRAANDRAWARAVADARSRWAKGQGIIGVGTLFHVAAEHGWRDSALTDESAESVVSAAPSVSATAAPAHAGLPAIDPTTWQGKAVPSRKWVIPGLLAAGSAALLTGKGGEGKSLLGQQTATCLASGIGLLGVPVEPASAIYITLEDSEDELHRRQTDINAALGCRHADLSRLRLVSLLGHSDTELVTFGRDGSARRGTLFDRIEALALELGASFVCLDHAAHFFGGNENDRHQVTVFTNLLNGLSLRIDGCVMLLGHESKAGAAYSGSTAWQGGVRQHWHIGRPVAVDGASIDPDERVLTLAKANYAQRGGEIAFVWERGAFVQRRPGLVSSTQSRDDAIFLDCLKAANVQQRAVSHSRNASNYAPKTFVAMPQAQKLRSDALAAAMVRLFTRGEISGDQRLWQRSNRDWVNGISTVESARGCVRPPVHDSHVLVYDNTCPTVHVPRCLYILYTGVPLSGAPPEYE